MTLNKDGLEAARNAIVYQAHPETPWSDDQVSAVITAYLSALPEPDEVTRKLRYRVNNPSAWPEGFDQSASELMGEAATVIQILQRERDEAMDSAHNWHAQCESIATILDLHEPECLGFAGEVRTKFEAAEQQVRDMRQIVSDCAAALPNGAFIAPTASIEFMKKLPDEIRSVCARLLLKEGGK